MEWVGDDKDAVLRTWVGWAESISVSTEDQAGM